jgi:hypothetical protein
LEALKGRLGKIRSNESQYYQLKIDTLVQTMGAK